MKYRLSVEIDVPRDKLARLYADPTQWAEWQESLVSYEPISGENRQEGSTTRLINRFGKRDVEIIETIEKNGLPETFSCTYEAPGAWNRVENRFTPLGPDRSRWEFETEFECKGMLRFLGILMPGMFRRSSLKEMEAFKKFAENRQSSIRRAQAV